MSYVSRQIHTRRVVAPSERLQAVLVKLPWKQHYPVNATPAFPANLVLVD